MGTVIPNKIFTKFRACDTWTPAASPSGGLVSFYANNPYDPVVGVSTTKCSGFTEMMHIYTYGICYGCKITVKQMPITVNSLVYCMFTDSTVSLPASAPSMNFLCECPRDCRWKHAPVKDYNANPPMIKMFRKMKYLEKKRELEPNDYKFTSSAGPAKAIGVQVGYIPANSTNATNYYNELFVRITYYCRLFDRQTATIAE